MKIWHWCLCALALGVGLISGYLYGFKAYNRPVKWWEFWLNNRTKFFDWLVGAKFE